MSVEIDGVNNIIKADTISEVTSANGVAVDGVTLKDGGLSATGSVVLQGTSTAAEHKATWVATNNSLDFGDSTQLRFGAGADLKIFHDGSDSHIVDSGTGNLKISTSALQIMNAAGNENLVLGTADGAVTLYHDNSAKLATTSTGVSVTGTGTFTVTDNSDALTLKTTDADSNVGPVLLFNRDSSSPANNDFLGELTFQGDNNAGEAHDYIRMFARILNVADGSEQADFIMKDATGNNIVNFAHSEVAFNDDSVDRDFRVESNNNTSLIKVDAGDDRTHFGGTSYQGMSLGVHNFHSGTTTDQAGLVIGSNSASYANNILKIATLRDQNNSYNFIAAFSGNGSDNLDDDLEFRAKGDGNVLCDESFTGSGADYSEYFEWSDGNSSDLDRVGLSVKLSGNKIVASSDSDNASDIIGVVSGSPVIVGDADGTGTRWTEKYLKDDYGRRIMEEFTVTSWRDEANKTDHSYATDRIPSDITVPDDATVTTTENDGSTKLLRRKLNPDYNSSLTYVARENRKEWDTVGLVGKLRMKKGQKTGTNWIKMRDISDTVEEWLVR